MSIWIKILRFNIEVHKRAHAWTSFFKGKDVVLMGFKAGRLFYYLPAALAAVLQRSKTTRKAGWCL